MESHVKKKKGKVGIMGFAGLEETDGIKVEK